MGKSLLLADDSVTIQKVVGLSFASEDIEIITVDNGDDALARARELRPDVILADVVMPGMSGYEVCEAIKAVAELQHIPVLLLTGTFEAFDDTRAAQVGAAGHVAKPFEAQTLVERVKELLANAPAPAPPVPETPPVIETAAPVVAMPPTQVDTAPTPDATISIDAPPPHVAPASFDFFDEPATSAPASSSSQTPAEGAFSFSSDDLEPAASAEPPPPAAHTIAILPDDLDAADSMLPPVPSSPEADVVPPVAPSGAPSESFDFEFESLRSQPAQEAIEPPAPTQIAEASLLDPAGNSAFDVSSSDLRELQFETPDGAVPPPPAPPTQLLDPADAMLPPERPVPAPPPMRQGIPSLDADPVMALLSSPQLPDDAAALVEATPETADPFETPEPSAQAESLSDPGFAMPVGEIEALAETPGPAPEAFAVPEPSIDALAAMVDEPMDPEPAWPAEAVDAEPVADAQLVSDEAIANSMPDAEALITEITPVLREQLHETLEKIAWESFGQITETIVEHAVERLEKAAWEVVPKLAETLILEEIRKLKGE